MARKATRDRWNTYSTEHMDIREGAVTRPFTAEEQAAVDLAGRKAAYLDAKASLQLAAIGGTASKFKAEIGRWQAIVAAGEPS